MITCVDPTGASLARGERSGILSVSHLATSTPRWTQEAHTGPISALAWSPTGLLLASGGHDGVVHIWQASTGALVCSFSHERPVKCLSWAPDGRILSAASGRTIHLWTVPQQGGLCPAV